MDASELKHRQVNNEEDDQVQVLSNLNVQDDTNQASSSSSHDNMQDQQVTSISSQPNDASKCKQSSCNTPTNQYCKRSSIGHYN
jgi:hypothetical protein